jgi:hypothetical protein
MGAAFTSRALFDSATCRNVTTNTGVLMILVVGLICVTGVLVCLSVLLLHDYGSGGGLDLNADSKKGPIAFIMPLAEWLRGDR